jgi:PAS domain-containing protein
MVTTFKPVFNKSFQICRIVGISYDITEQKIFENKLKQQIHFLQVLIDAIPNPVYYKDAVGKYQGCNSAFEKFSCHSRNQIIGKGAYDLYDSKLAEIYYKMD